MATSTHHLLLFLSLATLLSLLSTTTTARPCKTLSFISITYYPINHHPNHHPTEETTIFVNAHRPNFHFETARPSHLLDPIYPDRIHPDRYSSVKNSIRDRTKDIMSVVGALMFGVGCGALTSATMYLIWSLFGPNRFELGDSDDEEFEDVSDIKKKNGYVAIPQVVVGDDDAKPAKEVV